MTSRHVIAASMALAAVLALMTITCAYAWSYMDRVRALDVDPPAWMATCVTPAETRVTECNFQAMLHQLATTEHDREMSHRATREAFVWHHVASILIFFAVLSGFVSSMYFAYLEFVRDRLSGSASGADVFRAKFLGMEFNSSMIGLSILVMSFGFFLAYLKWVYPITQLVAAPG